jgi:Concanavalin A-like lectin/glucanases superfamily/FecR protein
MTLSDKEILELNELCNALVDDTLTEKQTTRLTGWLSESADARQFYIRATGLSASMYSYASEMQTEAPDSLPMPGKSTRRWKWVVGLLAMAALLVLMIWMRSAKNPGDVARAQPSPSPSTDTPAADDEFVAQLTGSKECRWASGTTPIQALAQLRQGQRVELASGFAEITFDCGAQVVLEGPASLDVISAWSATLNRGKLRASLPPEAMGFSIKNPSVEVVDLGTEFTMFTDASGAATDVLVLKGEVEAAPSTAGDQQAVVIREKELRHFTSTGISNLHDDGQKFAELTQPVILDHFVPATGFAHWSFDQDVHGAFKVDASGLAADVSDAQLLEVPQAALSTIHTQGRWKGALRFDGHLYAKATFPGISDNIPHTVVFWVRVPRDASPRNAYAMVAWNVNSTELRLHPIHICWNRLPNEGTVGALRTDYGAGFAIGDTPLRDGRWHHIAVVFMPRNDATQPMEVKQYVDGHFEGEGRPSPPGTASFMDAASSVARNTDGSFWLGCRLGVKGVRTDRFRGELSDLFIVPRALEPHEIVQLMNVNQLPN